MTKSFIKYIYIVIEVLIISVIFAFVYFNFDKTAVFFCPIMQKLYTTKLVNIAIMFTLSGFIFGYILCTLFKLKVAELCNAYQKRHENNSIEKDSDKARISTLEAKIETLEAALEAALKNK